MADYSKSIIQDFQKNGYYLAKGAISQSLAGVESVVEEVISKYHKLESLNDPSWVQFAVSNPNIVSKVYDEILSHKCFLELGGAKEIAEYVHLFIGQPLLYKKIPFRIDVPFNIKEFAYWHQDDFYVKGNQGEITAWMPLFDTFMQQGCLSVMPGSHKLGNIPHTIAAGKKSLPLGVYDREIRMIEMERGDCLFFSSLLLHSSNINISEEIRYSLQLRYTSSELESSTEMQGTVNV